MILCPPPLPPRVRTFELGRPLPFKPGASRRRRYALTVGNSLGRRRGCDDVSRAMEPGESDGGPKRPEGRRRLDEDLRLDEGWHLDQLVPDSPGKVGVSTCADATVGPALGLRGVL